MRILNRKVNPMMIDLVLGIIFFGILGSFIIIGLYVASVPVESFFDDSLLQIMIGYLTGILFSVILIIHMTASVERSLELGEHGALKHTRIMYIIRMVALVAVYAVMLIFGIGNVFSMLFGLFSLKLSAYIQPITHKMTSRLRTKKPDEKLD